MQTPVEYHETRATLLRTLQRVLGNTSTIAEALDLLVTWAEADQAAAEKAAQRAARPDDKVRHLPRLMCAWCQVELRPGSEPTSHGICPDCEAKVRGTMPDPDEKMGPG